VRDDWRRTKRFVAFAALVTVALIAARCSGTSRTSSSAKPQVSSSAKAKHGTPRTTAVPRPLRILTTSLPNAVAGSRYSVQLRATGGTLPYRWKKLGVAPPGLHLTVARNGLLHVLRTKKATPGTYTVKVSVRDRNKKTVTATLSLRMNAR
jgi:hypothetical protein